MTQPKDRDTTVSPETNEHIQHILDDIHAIAQKCHESSNETQAKSALTDIDNLPAATQMALLKALSKQQTDAADILLAIDELSDDKIIRKEARRSLIRLEEAENQPRLAIASFQSAGGFCWGSQPATVLERLHHAVA